MKDGDGRHDTLIRLAGFLLGADVQMDTERTVKALIAWDAARVRPPKGAAYVLEKVRNLAEKAAEREADQADQVVAHDERLTDLGNARRLVSRHGADLRYVKALRKWLVWDGRRWCADATDEVVRRAKEAVRAMYAEAATITDTDAREPLAAHALRSEAEQRIRAMVKLAESEEGVAVRPEVFDTDPFLLNCLNGTVDLRTGELGPHCPAGLITKLAPVEYDPNARSETWERYLHDATNGNPELAEFLRRAVGYSLTGDTGEEVLFFVHGPAAAGKSTFLEAIKATLGEYAMTTPFETLVARQFKGGPRDDIAGLAGARFVSSVEVDEGTRLAESLVKMLTGGDTVRARHLYQESFDFRPQCKLWLAANHAPKLRGDDPALWRRILRIPFEYAVPPERRDPAIKAALRNPSEAGAAILAWAVKGCLDWQRQRLGVPPLVEAATKAYQEEMDTFPDFLDDCCVTGPERHIAFRELYEAYEEWRRRHRERPLTRKALALQLKAHGFEPGATTKSRVYIGLALAPTATWGPDEDKPAAAAVGA